MFFFLIKIASKRSYLEILGGDMAILSSKLGKTLKRKSLVTG